MSESCKIELVLVVGGERQTLSSVPLPSPNVMNEGLDPTQLTIHEWFQRAVSGVIEIAYYHATTGEPPTIGDAA